MLNKTQNCFLMILVGLCSLASALLMLLANKKQKLTPTTLTIRQ